MRSYFWRGYHFTYTPGPPDSRGHISSFTIRARPSFYGSTGSHSFFTDQSGVTRWTHEDREATVNDRGVRGQRPRAVLPTNYPEEPKKIGAACAAPISPSPPLPGAFSFFLFSDGLFVSQ